MLTDLWPPFGLVLRTPRLELRLPSLEQLADLGELAAGGIHDPAFMPFMVPWTDAPAAERARGTIQYQWRVWAEWLPERWALNLIVLHGGAVVGTQEVRGTDFAVTREVATGSWLGREHQGRGIGTEMRAAVLHLAFAGLGAERAVSSAFLDNGPSQGVSRRLGYVPDGLLRVKRRGTLGLDQRLVLDRAAWEAHRTVEVGIEGLQACLPLLGLEPAPAPA